MLKYSSVTEFLSLLQILISHPRSLRRGSNLTQEFTQAATMDLIPEETSLRYPASYVAYYNSP